MREYVLKRPSPALIVAFVALLVALGGTSFAAFSLPKNSVGTKQLKNKAVTTTKIKNGAVTASKLNTSGLTVPNAQHASSANTATNATNATNAINATNATNATGLSAVGYVKGASVSIASGAEGFAFAQCPTGQEPIAGGGAGSSLAQFTTASFPDPNATETTALLLAPFEGAQPPVRSWVVSSRNTSSATTTLSAYAVCAPVGTHATTYTPTAHSAARR